MPQAKAQTKILADEVTHTSGNNKNTLTGCGPLGALPCINQPTVQNPNNALEDDNTYARLLASPGLALDLASYDGIIELKFNESLSADTWSYVRINGNNDLLRALLGGSLGEALGSILGAVLIGNQEIGIDARMGSTSVLSRNSNQGFNTDRVRLIKDENDNFLLAVRPDQDYDRLRITNTVGSLLGLGNEVTLDVYNAFYYDPNDPTGSCGRPLATSFDGGGLDLSLLNLGDQHLGRAIDDDMDSYSTLDNSSLLGLSVAASLSQYFYFPTESSETASVNIKLGMSSSGLLDLNLLGATEVIFYQGEDIVHERSLKSSLLHNTNALNLLDSGQPIIVTFAPGKAFDRIELRLSSPVDLSLINAAFRIYDVQRYDDEITGCENPEIDYPDPTDDPFDVASCATDLIDFENVDFAQRAVDGNNESYATIYASSGELLGGDPFAGYIEMGLGQMDANQTTYVRIGYDEDVLDRLLSGSLGKLVGDLADDLLLGNQYVQVEAINSNDPENPVLDQSSSNAFEGNAGGEVTIVQDNIGRYYLAITPDSDYDRIRITNHVTAVLPTGKQASLDVYNACFEIGTELCFPPNFTSYRGGGVNLSLGDLSDVGVTDPYKAISANSSEYSKINLGIAGIAANVYQTIYFNQPSQAEDHVQIRLMVEPSSALSLDLLGAYKIKFYNGNEQVGPDYDLQDGLLNNIDLLALFNSGGIVELDFEPEGVFDRVDIGAESLVSLNVAAEPLRVYSVKRYGEDCPLEIAESPFEAPSCAVELVESQNADDVQNLFDDDFDSYATLYSGKEGLLGLGGKYEGFVEMKYPQEIAKGTTSYIRFDFDQDILNALVSGTLGNIVADLLNNLLLDDHYFEVEAKNAQGATVASASSKEAATGGNNPVRVVQDAQGRYYIAITPDQDYQSVRITDKTDASINLTTSGNSMNVYGMCYETSPDRCIDAFATSYEYSGLNLGVDPVGAAGVTNPERAINGNTQHYSEISSGTIGVSVSTKQWIFFNTVSRDNDEVNIKLATGEGVVNANLLGSSLEITAYLGEQPVDTLEFPSSGIINGVDVVDLLNKGETMDIPFKPDGNFDRISVGINTTVSASVFPPVRLYSVTKRCKVGGLLITNPMIYQRVK